MAHFSLSTLKYVYHLLISEVFADQIWMPTQFHCFTDIVTEVHCVRVILDYPYCPENNFSSNYLTIKLSRIGLQITYNF